MKALDKWIAKAALIKARRSCSKSASSPLSKKNPICPIRRAITSIRIFLPTGRTNFARLQTYLEFKHVSDEGPNKSAVIINELEEVDTDEEDEGEEGGEEQSDDAEDEEDEEEGGQAPDGRKRRAP